MSSKTSKSGKAVDTIIFDFGGVVIHWKDEYFIEAFVDIIGVEKSKVRRLWEILEPLLSTGQISEEGFYDRVEKDLDIEKSSIPTNFLYKNFAQNSQLNEDVFSIIRKLKNNRYKVGLLSNIQEPHARYSREVGWFDIFDTVILSYEAHSKKPDAQIYRRVLSALKSKAQNSIYVDDREEYVAAAERLGMIGFLFTTTNQLREGLRQHDIKI